jgi:hypothetical protein
LKDALQELKDNNNCGLAPQHQVNPKKYPKNKIGKNLQVGSWDIFAFIFWFDRDMTIAISSVLKRESKPADRPCRLHYTSKIDERENNRSRPSKE